MSHDLYHDAAHALAHMMHAVSQRLPDGGLGWVHYHENNLHVVPDMLARLGVMREHAVHHEFHFDWRPSEPLPLSRHPDDPSLEDLFHGLEFCLAWYEPHNSTITNALAEVSAVLERIHRSHPEFKTWMGPAPENMLDKYWQ